MAYNKQAVVLLNQVDRMREQQEEVKFMFYNMDNSEGAQLLMKNTEQKPMYRARYQGPDALAYRNTLFDKNKEDGRQNG